MPHTLYPYTRIPLYPILYTRTIVLALLIALISIFYSCKTDFEVNAPWKDVTVVYGLLNQNDSIHYIKITKAFLGKADANDMAQVRDSSEYDPNDLSVVIDEMNTVGALVKSYQLTAITVTNKQSGTFYAPVQYLYSFIDTNLNEKSDYKLIITNKKSGKTISASTPIINKIPEFQASHGSPNIAFYSNGNYTAVPVEWQSAKNGKRYQLTMRFHYKEKNLDTDVEAEKFIDWIFPTVKSPDTDGGDKMSIEIGGEEFFKFVVNKIAPVSSSNNVERCIGYLDFILDVAGEDFNTYMEVNEPSLGIVQEKPEFTNVKDNSGNNQVGIFSCRYSEKIEDRKLDKSATFNTVMWLETGQYTSNYGFVDGTLFNCPY